MKRQRAPGVLVAVELGGEWPAWLNEEPAAPRRVIVQTEGESPDSFGLRASLRARELAIECTPIGSLVVACNGRADPAQMGARTSLARGLFEAFRARAPRLLLAAPARSSERLRLALGALASELRRGRNRIATDVRFGAVASELAPAADASSRVA